MGDRHQELADFIWSVADLLRGDYRRSEYGRVVLPFTVLRRLDCVLADTKKDVVTKARLLQGKVKNIEPILQEVAGHSFYNISELDFPGLLADSDNVAANLRSYIAGFSPGTAEVLEHFRFDDQITRLDEAGLLYLVTGRFTEIDLHPDTVDNHQMGYVFEELIRKFSENANDTAGEHFTPREVIRLMVNLLLIPDDEDLTVPGVVRTVFDPACGTGGMLFEAEDHIRRYNAHATVKVYGQELNPEAYGICRADMMLKGQDPGDIKYGNSFSKDQHEDRRGIRGFDYMLANPPFGVEWKKVQKAVEDERDTEGWRGRFGAGTPRINDGSLLFLQHMISKMKPVEQGGSRIAIVFNGSPLFTGAAGSGESEIRRWILEQDWLEAIIALPDQLFYNTGISTYFWILSNRKAPALRDKVILLDGRDYWKKMRKSLGDKRKLVNDAQIKELTEIYRDALTLAADENHPHHSKVKVFPRHAFGYQRITVERPLRQRFELTEDTLAALAETKQVTKYPAGDALLAALKPLIGTTTDHKAEFAMQLAAAYSSAGLKPPANVEKAVWGAVAVSDPEGELQVDRKNNPLPDSDLRDNENVPLTTMHAPDSQLRAEIDEYMEREVLPHVPDAWVDHSKTKIGFEIPFTRHFYVYKPPRPLDEIDAELKALESEIQTLLGQVTQ
ncbi:class I SAM-dependent DNA methyltransferase [Spirillospora sp. NPDC047418]